MSVSSQKSFCLESAETWLPNGPPTSCLFLLNWAQGSGRPPSPPAAVISPGGGGALPSSLRLLLRRRVRLSFSRAITLVASGAEERRERQREATKTIERERVRDAFAVVGLATLGPAALTGNPDSDKIEEERESERR